MIPKITFDLSEVLMFGLVGIEKQLSALVPTPENETLNCFGGQLLEEVCCGTISEDTYLNRVRTAQQWDIQPEILKGVIRKNFHQEIEGTIPILMKLSSSYGLVLLSDHAREWVSYIKTVHPFINVFEQRYFSYELGKTKKNPDTFLEVLEWLSCPAADCVLIDDSLINIEVAASVGIAGIQFTDAPQLHQALLDRQLL